MKKIFQNELILSVIAGTIGSIILILMDHHPVDDAYITFRHAKNFSDHNLLSWNLTPPYEMGSTSPLFAFIMGILGKIFGSGNMPEISLYFNAIFSVIFAIILFKVVKLIIEDKFIVFLIVLLVSINSYNIRIYSQGFESLLFATMIFYGVLLSHREKFIEACIIAGLSILIRPEGVYLIFLTIIIMIFNYKFSLKSMAVLIFPLIYITFSYLFYGQIIPQSVMAKKSFQELGMTLHSDILVDGLNSNLIYVIGFWNIMLKPVILFNGEAGLKLLDLPIRLGNFLFSSGNNLVYAISFFTLLLIWKDIKAKKLLHLSIVGYTYFFLVFIFFVKQISYWYIPIWNVSTLLLLSSGMFILLNDISTRYPNLKYNKLLLYFAYLIFIILLIDKNSFIINKSERKYDNLRGVIYAPAWGDNNEFERFLGYKYTADIINKLNPNGTLLTNEVGILGYYFNGTVLDEFGLCSREIISFYKEEKANNIKPAKIENIVRRFNPDFIIQGLTQSEIDELLKQNYTLLEKTEYNVFGLPMYVLIKVKE